jgi:two-component sensor histidine kinase
LDSKISPTNPNDLPAPGTLPLPTTHDGGPGAWWDWAWRFLFSPHPSIQGDEARYRSTMVSVLALALALLSVVGAFAEPIHKVALLVVAVIRLLTYLLSRYRYYKLAAYLTVAGALVLPYVVLAQLPTYNPGSVGTTLQWLIIPVFLAGVVLDIPSLALTIVAAAGGLVVTALLIPGLTVGELAPTIGLTFNVAIFSLVTAILQQRYFAQRARVEAQVRGSLQEKEVLLKEIHHRVKNNLQVVSSLLNLQAGQTDNGLATALLRDSQNRIKAMALIHENLYQSSDLALINFASYATGLLQFLIPAYDTENKVTFQVKAEEMWLNLEEAIPCGLIINELISNALKHAFPDRESGLIQVEMGQDGAWLHLSVKDDGVGFPKGIDFRNTGSLGLQLVNSLASQLDGTVELLNGMGTTFTITFPAGSDQAQGDGSR